MRYYLLLGIALLIIALFIKIYVDTASDTSVWTIEGIAVICAIYGIFSILEGVVVKVIILKGWL